MNQSEASPATLTSRRLLARIRDVMAGAGDAQRRLDKLVSLIAGGMGAEVCSVYLLRAGEILELFATEGLLPSAVHVTRMRLGEGLTGDIAAHAKPVALSDAPHHPLFAYRPETGEELFQSFMGVPIVREGRVLGVLAVQNKIEREYSEEEMESLLTVAMVIAELVAGGELIDPSEILPAVDGIGLLPLRLEGAQLNAGVARGVAVLHERSIVVDRLVADDADSEQRRLLIAVKEMHGALDNLLREDLLADGEHRDIMETYRMIAEDAGWLTRIEEAINGGLTAGAAVQKVQQETYQRMSQVADPYLRERGQDFDDLANRLLQHLTGQIDAQVKELPDRAVIIARAIGPAELLDYDISRVAGLILEHGAPTSHVAIIARALDLPVVGRVKGLFDRVAHLDPVVIDADNEQVFIRPGDDVIDAFDQTIRIRETKKLAYAALRDLPAETRDGIAITLMLNVGLQADLHHLYETAADGIGLYRTEIPFMTRSEMPDVEDQVRIYKRILDTAEGKPVTFRSLDAGGDKVLSYWEDADEENPAMGWRAVRLTLDRPSIFRQQLRAFIQAAAGRELRVMFPMIAEVAEFDAARDLLDLELDREAKAGRDLPKILEVGAMLEVPALMFQMPALLARVDFLSIGTNDLMQFMFAADRSNPVMAKRYDVLSPPVLSALRQVIADADAAGVPIQLCGEVGSQPLEAMAMIGIGLRQFSVPASTLGPVKAMIRNLDAEQATDFVSRLLVEAKHSIREDLRNFALDQRIPV